MRKFCPVAYIASVGIVTQLNAQSVNWRELTNELVSTNSGTRDAARDKMLSVIIPKLISESPEAVDRDLQEILKASAGGSDDVQREISALFFTLAYDRPDGTISLNRIVPLLLSQMHDRTPRIRYNAILSISNLKPTMPAEAEAVLMQALGDNDKKVVRGAAYGVARFSLQSSESANALANVMYQGQDKGTLISILRTVGYVHVTNPVVIGKLGELMMSKDVDVSKEALVAAGQLGDLASALLQTVEALESGNSNSEIAQTAREVAAKIDGGK